MKIDISLLALDGAYRATILIDGKFASRAQAPSRYQAIQEALVHLPNMTEEYGAEFWEWMGAIAATQVG